MIMNRYWPELVCSKALPPCERQGDRHTPPYPLSVTFDVVSITKRLILFSSSLTQLSGFSFCY